MNPHDRNLAKIAAHGVAFSTVSFAQALARKAYPRTEFDVSPREHRPRNNTRPRPIRRTYIMPDITEIAEHFTRRKFWHNHKNIKVTIDGDVHHYGCRIASWTPTPAFGRTVYIPTVGYNGRVTEPRLLLIREIVRVLGIPNMSFGVITSRKRHGPQWRVTHTPTLNGVEIEPADRIALCNELGAMALAVNFNHPKIDAQL